MADGIQLDTGAGGDILDASDQGSSTKRQRVFAYGGLELDSNNSTTTPLNADATFTGTATNVLGYAQIHVVMKMSPNAIPDGDANTAQGSMYVEFSPDGTNWDISIPIICRNGLFIPQAYIGVDKWFRIRYINDGSVAAIASLGSSETADTARNQAAFRLNAYLVRSGTKDLGRTMDQGISPSDPCSVTRAVIMGSPPTAGANLINVGVNPTGNLIIADFLTEVAKGNVSGHTLYRGFGRNSDVDTAVETIWAQGGAYTFPAAAQTLDVVSADANDTSAGTGARTVLIEGLDASYDEITETVTMDGTNAVTTTATFLRVNRATVKTAGSGGENAGVITIDQTTSGTVVAAIEAGTNQSQLGLYTIPNNKTGYLVQISPGAMKASASGVDVDLCIRPTGEVFQVKGTFGTHTQSSQVPIPFVAPEVLAEHTDIRFDATATANNTQVSIGFSILIVNDGS